MVYWYIMYTILYTLYIVRRLFNVRENLYSNIILINNNYESLLTTGHQVVRDASDATEHKHAT